MWRRSSKKKPTGSIIRHEKRVKGQLVEGDLALAEAMDAHLTTHYGEPAAVWHELISINVHVDVWVVGPAPGRPAKVLATTGMSQRPMAGSDGPLYAELVMFVPPDWELVDDAGRPSWPVTLLQDLARLPHDFDTVFWTGHTIPNADPPEPYAPTTALCGALLAAPSLTAPEFDELVVGDRTIQFLAVIPLHAAEMDYKLEHGSTALLERLDEAGVSEALQEDRASAV